MLEEPRYPPCFLSFQSTLSLVCIGVTMGIYSWLHDNSTTAQRFHSGFFLALLNTTALPCGVTTQRRAICLFVVTPGGEVGRVYCDYGVVLCSLHANRD